MTDNEEEEEEWRLTSTIPYRHTHRIRNCSSLPDFELGYRSVSVSEENLKEGCATHNNNIYIYISHTFPSTNYHYFCLSALTVRHQTGKKTAITHIKLYGFIEFKIRLWVIKTQCLSREIICLLVAATDKILREGTDKKVAGERISASLTP